MGAERSQLLNENKLKTLTKAKDLTELVMQLRESSYQTQVNKVLEPLTSRKLERAFTENLVETYIKIVKNSPKKAASFLRLYLFRYEIENIKALIKVANTNLSPEQKIAKIHLSSETYLKRRAAIEEAAKATDLGQTVNALKKTEYVSALKMGMGSYEEGGSTTCFDVLLDKHFYEKYSEAFESLPKREKPFASFYVSMENDAFVLLMLLRGKNLRYSPNWLRLAVPSTRYNLSDETVEAIVTAPNFDSAFKIVSETHYSKFFIKASSPEETVGNAEKTFRRGVFLHAKESRLTEIFNVGAVLAFLTRKETEVHNLSVVSLGLEAGLKPEDIQSQLLL